MASVYGLGYFDMKNGDKVSYELINNEVKYEFVGIVNQITNDRTHVRITIPSREGAYIVLPIGEVRLCD